MKKQKYNWASLFKNKNGGKPMIKDGKVIINKDGQQVLIPEYLCSLSIVDKLEAGEYEIKFREKVSQKGNLYFAGGVLAKKDNGYQPTKHDQDKANGYQPQKHDQWLSASKKEFEDDEIPF